MFPPRLGPRFWRLDGDIQSCGLSKGVLTVREEAGGTFAVLDVGASRLFEQPKAREHEDKSSNTIFHSHRRSCNRGKGISQRDKFVSFRITDAFVKWALWTGHTSRSSTTPLPHGHQAETRTEGRDRVYQGAARENRVRAFPPLFAGKMIDP